ncbi:MAG: hypothetical protein PVF34_10200 [Gammaproteobacteria bacterium]|jgi:hypothetical protein
MRTRKKPDLLFLLALFVGIGIVFSSYIQHMQANPTLAESSSPTSSEQVAEKFSLENQIVHLNPRTEPSVIRVKSGAVNNSPLRP